MLYIWLWGLPRIILSDAFCNPRCLMLYADSWLEASHTDLPDRAVYLVKTFSFSLSPVSLENRARHQVKMVKINTHFLTKTSRQGSPTRRACLHCHISTSYFNTNAEMFMNASHPDISVHPLHSVLYIFPYMLTRRICLTCKQELL